MPVLTTALLVKTKAVIVPWIKKYFAMMVTTGQGQQLGNNWNNFKKWSWNAGNRFASQGFQLNTGNWTLWKRPSGGFNTSQQTTSIQPGGMSSTTLIALLAGAYLLFKR